uniref:Uncharacterized protein n=1 Tax=viral metagenome TaxID=1070528 RepID=A0A6C0IVM8_9ZZZZ
MKQQTTIKKIINIDSRFRENFNDSASSDFTVKLNYPLSGVLSMRLDQIEVPNSWYNISKKIGNNKIKIMMNNIDYEFLLNDGMYSYGEVKEALENSMSNGRKFSSLFTFDIDEYSNKITISSKSNLKLTINFGNNERTLGWFIGYKKKLYENASTYTAENMFNDTNNRYFYLVINDFNTNINDYIIGNLKDYYINDNIIARISVIDTKYNIISNFNNDSHGTQTRVYTSRSNIDKLHIKLLDEYGQVLDLNGLDISFTLEFQLFVK